MKSTIVKLAGVALLVGIATPSIAMPEGDHMMGGKMSAKHMKRMEACKKMDPAKAMKNKRCAKMMKHDDNMMKHDDAMGDHKM